jgi:hypothetical protein
VRHDFPQKWGILANLHAVVHPDGDPAGMRSAMLARLGNSRNDPRGASVVPHLPRIIGTS